MNRIKAAFILFTLAATVFLFPLKTEAALHPYFNVQEFYDSYNFWVEQSRRRSDAFPMPLIESLTSSEEEPWEFYGDFDDTFPNTKIFITTNRSGKMISLHISKEIEGYTQINGRTYPKDIFKLNQLMGMIIFSLEYPTGTKQDRQRVADVVSDASCNYDADTKYYLYNPMTQTTYELFYRISSKGYIVFFLQNYD